MRLSQLARTDWRREWNWNPTFSRRISLCFAAVHLQGQKLSLLEINERNEGDIPDPKNNYTFRRDLSLRRVAPDQRETGIKISLLS